MALIVGDGSCAERIENVRRHEETRGSADDGRASAISQRCWEGREMIPEMTDKG